MKEGSPPVVFLHLLSVVTGVVAIVSSGVIVVVVVVIVVDKHFHEVVESNGCFLHSSSQRSKHSVRP